MPAKPKLYGAATITDQDTIHTAPWVPNDVWDTTIFCQDGYDVNEVELPTYHGEYKPPLVR